MAHKRTTSSKVASKAGRLLGNSKTPKAIRSVAASALGQKHGKRSR